MNAQEFEQLRAVERDHAWFVGRRRAARPVLERAHALAPAGPALDLGTGTGGNRELLEQALAGRVLLAIDPSPHARAPRLARAAARALPLADGALAVVAALDVLEHCEDDSLALRELARCLLPGGQVVINVPAFSRIHSDHDRALGHVRRYDRGELEEKLDQADFEVEERRGFNLLSLAPVAITRLLRRGEQRPRSDVRELPGLLNRALDRTLALEEHLPRCLTRDFGLSWMMRARRR